MSRILQMDEVIVGMFITILTGKKSSQTVRTPKGPVTKLREESLYKGDVLRVACLEMPYIVVNQYRYLGTTLKTKAVTLDLREIKIVSLSDDFVRSLLPGLKINRDPFWDDVEDTSIEDADTTIKKIFKDL